MDRDRCGWSDWLEMSAPTSPSASQAGQFQPGTGALSKSSLRRATPRYGPQPWSRYSDGLEQPQERAKESTEDPIAALKSQFESQFAAIELRVGKLELQWKAVAATDAVISFRPDAPQGKGDAPLLHLVREATIDQPETVADTNPDATVGGADTAELEQTCELQESMWDSPLFLGRRDIGMGRAVTLWTLLVLLLNTLLQTTIAVIVLLNMGDPVFVPSMIEDLWYA
jgi:hypothetical protein